MTRNEILDALHSKVGHADFGAPGALTHFIEQFYQNGYEELLLKSVRSKPTAHNVWLLHRLWNGCY